MGGLGSGTSVSSASLVSLPPYLFSLFLLPSLSPPATPIYLPPINQPELATDLPPTTTKSFYYLTGFPYPGNAAATYDISADKLTLWIPRPAPPATVLWLGNATTPSPEDVLASSDVHDVQFAADNLPRYLAARLPRVRGPRKYLPN